MSDQLLGPIVQREEIARELRSRRSRDIFKTVRGSTRKIVAEKVTLEQADGWSIARKNIKSTRMSRPKPIDEQFEDEIWCILAQMGFEELSKGRTFSISIGNTVPARQIDVFAKDDETVIIVECTRRQKPGRKPMNSLIEKLKSIREAAHHSITSHYGRRPKLKIKYVIATRNISWSSVDLAKCADAQIAVLTEDEINYYKNLVKHIKHAARYQLLAHMFEGTGVSGLAKTVIATRGKMGDVKFYTFLIRPSELLKIAYIGHKASRDIESLDTYQRMLQPARLKKIAAYINDGGKFPTNIVVNVKTKRRGGLLFETKEKVGEEALGILQLPASYASAWIIDGQHRLYGYSYAERDGSFQDDKSKIPVLAFENLPAEKEMNLFIDINSKQVKVNTGLLVELYSDLHWCSSDPGEAFQALLCRTASRLNSRPTSPLHGRMVVSGKRKTRKRCLTQTSMRDGLAVARLLGSSSARAIVPGPLSTGNVMDYGANMEKALSVLCECFRLFQDRASEHWELGDAPGGYLCTNNGIRALFHVIKDVCDHVGVCIGNDLYNLSADNVLEQLLPYMNVLAEVFANASPDEVRNFRKTGSSLTAVRQQSYGMEAQVRETFADFRPSGLIEYLESRDEKGTARAAETIRSIHGRLFSYVIETLKEHYGTGNKAWWTKGVPLTIRQSCTAEWEAKSREGEEESNLYLISYVDICGDNWDLFKDVISLGEKDKDNRKKRTKWIRDLNELRKITAHPERGVLSITQVSFVNEIAEKCARYLPT